MRPIYLINLETKKRIGTHGKAFWVCLATATKDDDSSVTYSESLSGDTYEEAKERTLAALKDTLDRTRTDVDEAYYYSPETKELTPWPLKPGYTIEGSSV